MRSGKRRTAVAALGWVAAAVLATLIGMGGIRLIGDSLTTTPGGVLDQQDVAKALAASPSAQPTAPGASDVPGPSDMPDGASGPNASNGPSGSGEPSADPDNSPKPTTKPATTPAGEQRGFSSTGGTVVAGCRNGQPYLVSWSPSPGYHVTQQETESEHVDVRFEGSGGRSDIRVACSGNTPVQQQHGGGKGR
jgi:hypothetical protein